MLFWDFFYNVVDEGLEDPFDMGVVCVPCVDGEPVLASEEVFEEGPVWCLWRDVDRALEPNILVYPDRLPAETVLDKREVAIKKLGTQTLL